MDTFDINAEFCRNLKKETSEDAIEEFIDHAYAYILHLIVDKAQEGKRSLWDDISCSVYACNRGRYEVKTRDVVNAIVKKLREKGFSLFRIPFTDIYRISWA